MSEINALSQDEGTGTKERVTRKGARERELGKTAGAKRNRVGSRNSKSDALTIPEPRSE
jgi:hypothetical protein